jgi:hypothetical protein
MMKDKWLDIKKVERSIMRESKIGKIDAVLWSDDWIVED